MVSNLAQHHPDATYIVSNQDTIDKLQSSDNNKEEQKGINQLRALRRLLDVVVVDVLNDDVPVGRGCFARGGLCWG